MKEPIDYQALALHALQRKPSREWGCTDLQRHYNLSYSQATYLLDTIRAIADADMGVESAPRILTVLELDAATRRAAILHEHLVKAALAVRKVNADYDRIEIDYLAHIQETLKRP